jgi:hypothetical protein
MTHTGETSVSHEWLVLIGIVGLGFIVRAMSIDARRKRFRMMKMWTSCRHDVSNF